MLNARFLYIVYAFAFFFVVHKGFPQEYKNTDVCKTEVIYFKKSFFLFSYKETPSNLLLVVDRLSDSLKVIQSFELNLGKKKCVDFYAPQVDTLHGFINLSIQQSNNDKITRVVRLTSELALKADLPASDITRVNTFTAFEKEFYYYKNKLYVVRPLSKDSANKFILQQYTLKDAATVFEYTTGWQLNFAKQKYHRCHIIRVDENFVYVFATVIEGSKKGQWILFIDPLKGDILQAEQLNNENENFTYLFANSSYNHLSNEFVVVGYKLPEKNCGVDYTKVDLTIGKAKVFPVFICVFDSAGFLIEKKENSIPVPIDLEREKEFKQYLCKLVKLNYDNNKFSILAEILAAPANSKSFKTYGYLFCILEHDENNNLKATTAQFICSYRDSKNKEAKNSCNEYSYEGKQDADELFYRKPISSVFVGFSWSLTLSTERIIGYSNFITKSKKQVAYKYMFENKKWIVAELMNTNTFPYFKPFISSSGGFYYFFSDKMDEGTRYPVGVSGGVKW